MTPADLTAARKRLGLSQTALADRLGVQRLAVGRWERGERAIPPFLHLAMTALADEASRTASPDHQSR
jgi:transcriptional regulator with XRE-family HTH domain